MAKRMSKSSRKTGRAGSSRGGKKTSKKTKASAGKTKRASTTAPVAVRTGGGAAPGEVGRAVVTHFNAGRPDRDLWDKFWSRNVSSVEGEGVGMAWNGRKAMEAKAEWWLSNHTVLGASAEGPFVGATGFSIRFKMDVEEKATGNRYITEEIGVYTVQGGKVVREEFFYGPRQPVPGAVAVVEVVEREDAMMM